MRYNGHSRALQTHVFSADRFVPGSTDYLNLLPSPVLRCLQNV